MGIGAARLRNIATEGVKGWNSLRGESPGPRHVRLNHSSPASQTTAELHVGAHRARGRPRPRRRIRRAGCGRFAAFVGDRERRQHWTEAISGPSVSLCVAVDAAGDVVTSTDPSGGHAACSPPMKVDNYQLPSSVRTEIDLRRVHR